MRRSLLYSHGVEADGALQISEAGAPEHAHLSKSIYKSLSSVTDSWTWEAAPQERKSTCCLR